MSRRTKTLTGTLLLLLSLFPAINAAHNTTPGEITDSDRKILLAELARVQPPERLRELSGYNDLQLELGGGFYGLMPEQLPDPDSIPVPTDRAGLNKAAACLERQRESNLAALKEFNPGYTLEFKGESPHRSLERIGLTDETIGSVKGLSLVLDYSALTGFFDALEDGEILESEAGALAALPSNQAMLQHRKNLGYVPEPLPDTGSLAKMIRMAGSPDPLDRLWIWLNPQNAFGYADLVQNKDEYLRFLSELKEYEGDITAAALGKIGGYVPPDMQSEVHFAFTVGWAIRGWATPDMVGLNIEQPKDDWDHMLGTLIEETYHRLQIELCPAAGGGTATDFSDLTSVDTGDERYDALYAMITYSMLEGVANLVRGPFASDDLPGKVEPGSELMSRFVDEVIEQWGVEDVDAFISEGLRNNGPLYGLGWKLASLIEEKSGKQAVVKYQGMGAVPFFLEGAKIAEDNGDPILANKVIAAITILSGKI